MTSLQNIATLPRPRLRPVESMKQFCLERMTDEEFTRVLDFKEYGLEGEPQSSAELLALFQSVRLYRDLLWITETSFIFTHRKQLPEPYHFPKLRLWLGTGMTDQFFWIYGATFEDAFSGVDFLEKLSDTNLQRAKLCFYNVGAVPSPFPLADSYLVQMTQNYSRIDFSNISFTAAQCCALVHCTEISLSHCIFSDGGAAMFEAITQEQQDLRWKKVEMIDCLPLDDLGLLLKQRKLDLLKLCNISLRSEARHSLTTALGQTFHLVLENCILDDGGTSLLKSLQEKTGPRELSISGADSCLVGLLGAILRRNTISYLQRLSLHGKNQDMSFWRALTAVLCKDEGLLNLCIDMWYPKVSHACYQELWGDLMNALARHPILQNILIFCSIVHEEEDNKHRISRTRTLARMLERNSRIEHIGFRHRMYDKCEWNATVLPKLECNQWRQRLLAILKNGDHPRPHNQAAALVGQALSRLQGSPWLVWLQLRQCSDIIVCAYLEQHQA